MARVKRAVNAKKKRREILEQASGYRGQRSRLYRKAKEQVQHSGTYSFRDRKARKGDFRSLWIQRINAASRAEGMTYNRFINGLKNAGVKNENKNKFMEDATVAEAIARVEEEVKGNGRVLIRPSGTEPVARVMIEGQDVEHITALAEDLARLITKHFG